MLVVDSGAPGPKASSKKRLGSYQGGEEEERDAARQASMELERELAGVLKQHKAAQTQLEVLQSQEAAAQQALETERAASKAQIKESQSELERLRQESKQQRAGLEHEREAAAASHSRELKDLQREHSTQLAAKAQECQRLEQELAATRARLEEAEQDKAGLEKSVQAKGTKLGALEDKQAQLNNKIRTLEKQLASASLESQAGEEQLEELEWELLARWQPNQRQLDEFDPEPDEDQGFMIEVKHQYQQEHEQHLKLIEGATVYVSNWSHLQAPGANTSLLWYGQILEEGEFGDSGWFPVKHVRCEDEDAMIRAKTYVAKLSLLS